MSYTSANNYGGGQTEPARALDALTSAAQQLLIDMHLAGWNWTVATDSIAYGRPTIEMGGIDPNTHDRAELRWERQPDRSRRGGWAGYRLVSVQWAHRGGKLRPSSMRQVAEFLRMDTDAGRAVWAA